MLSAVSAASTLLFERFVFRPWGAAGGMPGAPARVVLNIGRTDERELGKLDVLEVRKGDTVTMMTPGGGGYGSPFERPAEAVLADVRLGFVSRGSAERDYGVALKGEVVDEPATRALRQRLGATPRPAFDFGPERRRWEAVFDDDLVNALNRKLAPLAMAARARVRAQVYHAVAPLLMETHAQLGDAITDPAGQRARLAAAIERVPGDGYRCVTAPAARAACRIGIDVGGTFNDFVLADDARERLVYFKEPSVPADPSLAVERGIRTLLAEAACSPQSVGLVIHGTTLGLNAILQRRGARLGLVVSRGNRDVFEIARSRMPSAYDFTASRETPLVPRDLVFELDARVTPNGAIVARPDERAYDTLALNLRHAKVEAVAVMLLNAYRQPALEREAGAALRRRLPGVAVTESAAIWPELREYERALLAALNASVQPLLVAYFERLKQRLAGLGIAAPIYVTTNSGGTISLRTARDRPIETLLSGPASGVSAALRLAPASRRRRMITLDMGGTSSDIAVVHDAQPEFTMQARIGNYPLILPVIGVNAIGAGGGSLVWLDDQRVPKVGPESAGAEPGPACYGLGGQRATVTDCYLATGILDPDHFLGGRMKLHRDRALAALAEVAAGLGFEDPDRALHAASAVLRIATTKMAVEISKMLAKRGHDHREFALCAYGGAGPTHANLLAREARLAAIIVPPSPGTFCALGALCADLRRDYAQSLSHVLQPAAADFAPVSAALAEMEREAVSWIAGEGGSVGEPRLAIAAEMGYPAQAYEVPVAIPEADRRMLDARAHVALFHDEHERLFGFADRHLPVRVSTLRLSVSTPAPPLALPQLRAGTGVAAPVGTRRVFHDGGWINAGLHARRDIAAGTTVTGPALIEQPDTTIWILPGWSGATDNVGNLLLAPA